MRVDNVKITIDIPVYFNQPDKKRICLYKRIMGRSH